MQPIRPRIKICGITRPGDATRAAELGVDAIGLVFYPPSPRCVGIDRAREIIQALPPFVSVAGLFVNAGHDEVENVLKQVTLDILQFHGDEEPDYCGAFNRPYIKALRMRDGLDISRKSAAYGGARGILVDAWSQGVPGGTGKTFDWGRVPASVSAPRLILAGGLHAGNVAEAIARAHPWAVDASSGVESAPGIKSAEKMADFVTAVRESEHAI